MTSLLLLTPQPAEVAEVLPSLDLLGHEVTVDSLSVAACLRHPDAELLLVDARRELGSARTLCRELSEREDGRPAVGIFTEGGLTALSAGWGLHEVVLADAGPAELSARLRLATERARPSGEAEPAGPISTSGLVVDESSYTAKVHGIPLNLTFREFELLKHLAQHPGQVFSREYLLAEVWGQDYLGGTRTVDVHVRRLRAKLGPDREQLIGTVRHVGYRFVPRDHPGQESAG